VDAFLCVRILLLHFYVLLTVTYIKNKFIQSLIAKVIGNICCYSGCTVVSDVVVVVVVGGGVCNRSDEKQ